VFIKGWVKEKGSLSRPMAVVGGTYGLSLKKIYKPDLESRFYICPKTALNCFKLNYRPMSGSLAYNETVFIKSSPSILMLFVGIILCGPSILK
jgi:hypothetical protein